MKLIILIPAYNEKSTIIRVIKSIPLHINNIREIQILVIDDGSTDNTVEKVKSETNAFVITSNRNRGVGVAFQTGIRYALENKADIVVNIDADGQFNPLDIPTLIQPIINNEADFVTASRFINKSFMPNITQIKFWGNKQMSRLISFLLKEKYFDVSCGFRAFNKEAILNLNLFGKFTYTQEVFLDLGLKGIRIKEVSIKVQYFPHRQSRVYKNPFHYAIQTLLIILRTFRDYKPLRFFGYIGLVIFGLGLIFDLIVFVYYINTGSFTPYKSIILVGAFLNIIGFTIMILALISDMLFRIRVNQEKILYYQKKRYYYS